MALAPPNGLAAIKQAAAANGLDWRPLAAIAHHESGLNPAAVGDQGTSFGLFQLHQGGALPAGTPASQATNPLWNANFAARQIKGLNIQGLPVAQQIAQISRRFERPADPASEIADAQRYYQTALAGAPATAGMPAPTAAGADPRAAGRSGLPTGGSLAPQSLAPLQAGFGLAQASGQRALDALGKLSGHSVQAPAAPNLAALTTSASTQLQPTAPTHPTKTVSVKPGAPLPAGLNPQEQKVVELAKTYLGDKYVFGGSTHAGIDCSGLITDIYAKLGVKLPHNAAAQFQLGKPVGLKNLQPGQPIFFRNSSGIHHVGLYIGGPNNSFIQAPHTGDVVKISSLNDPYYSGQFAGGRNYL